MSKHFTPAELVEGFTELHTLPEIYFRIKAVVDDPNSQSSDLVRELSTDAAMTARILRVVSSPLYARHGKVETLLRAVAVLGTRAIHDLVLATSITGMLARKTLPTLDLRAHWRDSLLTGLIARYLGEALRLVDKDRLFVEGMLCRIGQIVMHERGGSVARIVAQHAQKKNLPLHQAQRSFLGCHYAEVGGALFRKWALSEAITTAVEKHLDGASEGEIADVSLLRVSAMMCAWPEGVPPEDFLTIAQTSSPAIDWNLQSERFGEIHDLCLMELGTVQQAFLPAASAA